MTAHAMATTTHTTELRQIEEMNAALSGGARPTAAWLGIRDRVPGDAVLRGLRAAGPPSYPYIYGIFARDGGTAADGRPVPVELHTRQLRAITDRLHLRAHIWGV